MFESEIAHQLKIIAFLREINPKLTLEEAGVLMVVFYHGKVPMKTISEKLSLSNVSIHRIVAALSEDEGLGFVETMEDPENRVRKIAYLTPKGEELRKQLLGILKEKELVETSAKPSKGTKKKP